MAGECGPKGGEVLSVPDYRGPTLWERIQANTARLVQRHDARKDDALDQIEQAKRSAAGAMATGRASDAELRALADRRAWLMQDRIDHARGPVGLADLNAWIEPLQARPFVLQGDRPEADQLRGMIARTRCPLWWRRQLRRAAVLLREVEANDAGEVCATKRQAYVTHDTAHRHQLRRAAAALMMEATELENEDGQTMTLADLAAASVSNKAIRRGELMTRITGCEKWAEALKLRGVFLTLTAPSRFHRVHRTGALNDRWQGDTPRDAQQWLCKAWARARAKLQRAGVALFGFRVAEPHHDGCPHWHALLWAAPGQLWRAVRIIKRAWLKLDGTEPGARAHRCKAVLMRPGGASGYIAKYVAKNIDDAGAVGAEGHSDDGGGSVGADGLPAAAADAAGPGRAVDSSQGDLFGGTAKRVEAWASAWGIRQFQAIGQPPVTVWRELRRIKEAAGSTARLARALEACNRDDTRRADWAAYVLAQGGMNTGRNYLLRVAMVDRLKVGRYETAERACPIGVKDSTGPGDVQLSDRKEWRPRGQWTEADKVRGPWAPRVSPWTRVNNCTRAGKLEVWTERIKREPWGGRTLESDPEPCLPVPPDRLPTTSRLYLTLQRVRLSRATSMRPST